ncbi:MAG: ABC transporter permease [Chloroflexi bacterium]|nr:ABC transporter permease [Chloroflexota bacterium]
MSQQVRPAASAAPGATNGQAASPNTQHRVPSGRPNTQSLPMGKPRRRLPAWLAPFRESGAVALGAGILLLATLIAITAPLLAPVDPLRIDLLRKLQPPVWAGGAWPNLLGTDHLGRDVLSRTLYGTQISLIVGLFSVIGSGTLGIALGLLAGYFRGMVDAVIMRVADVQQSFPYLALAIAVVAVLGPGLWNLILVLAATGWILYARVVRAEVLSIREREFVLSARAMGATDLRIMLRHVLPNILAPTIIVATFSFAYVIIAEASLSFLGLGVDPSTPSWGLMLSESRNYLQVAWWYPSFPGIALLVTVMGTNLLGDGLRDLWDPRLQQD